MLDIDQIVSFYPEYLRPFKRNLLREYLQYKIIEAVFDSQYGERLAFMGGTAIHMVHANARFSEDLDFDKLGLDRDGFSQLAAQVKRRLVLEGCAAETKVVFRGAYHCHVSIADILFASGLSGHKNEKLLISVDAEPQHFQYRRDAVILNKFDLLMRIGVVPPDILLAQKLVAILKRKRTMGRDLYDTLFLFGKTKPNFEYLKQKADICDMAQLKKALLKKFKGLDLKKLIRDLEQFLFLPDDAKKILLLPEYVRGLEASPVDGRK